MGRDPKISVRFHDSLELGSEAYMAHFDVFHQIHCLNALRKTAFKDYPNYPTKPHDHRPELKYIHLAHCVDILVQNLMCQPNVDLITYNWVETQSIPVADFNIKHQCRNWDVIAAWQKGNSVPEEKWVGMPKTDDVRWLPQEDGYFDVFGHDEHDHDRFVSGHSYDV
jgi:Mycotoxin biosynthesis protein UstYa